MHAFLSKVLVRGLGLVYLSLIVLCGCGGAPDTAGPYQPTAEQEKEQANSNEFYAKHKSDMKPENGAGKVDGSAEFYKKYKAGKRP